MLYRTPSILFLHTNGPEDQVRKEADELCFQKRALAAVDSLQSYLESLPVPGDGVLSLRLAEWHRARFEELKTEPRHLHLFDPSKLVVKVVDNLVAFIRDNNRLDIGKKSIVIPLDFIRTWHRTVTQQILADDAYVHIFT